jgi:hypothetical protein
MEFSSALALRIRRQAWRRAGGPEMPTFQRLEGALSVNACQ